MALNRVILFVLITAATAVVWAQTVLAQPISEVIVTPTTGTDRFVAASGVGGLWAASDGVVVVVRDVRGETRFARSIADFAAVLPGLDSTSARFGQLTMSDSGRLLFVTVQRPARTDTLTSRTDEVVRIDVESGAMSRFVTIPLSGLGLASAQSFPLVHAGGRLYAGGPASVIIYSAGRNDVTGTVLTGYPGLAPGVAGLAFDRAGPWLFAVLRDQRLVRFNTVTGQATVLTSIGGEATSLAFCDHHGAGGNAGGLFVGTPDGRVLLLTSGFARGAGPFTLSQYDHVGATTPAMTRLAAGFDGRLLVGRLAQTVAIRDGSDSRMGVEAWIRSELTQQVAFAKSLVSPGSLPSGWVIDGNVVPGGTLFHPATPDAAAWAVLLLLAADEVLDDPDARPLIRTILNRYAGRSAGPVPSRTADGVFRHWVDPITGGVKPGWDPEFATMSTMKIVAAAARAANYYSDDAEITASARSICCGVRNHSAYVHPVNRSLYLKSLVGGGPDPSSSLAPFHEGIMFVEQAAFYGTAVSAAAFDAWLDRSLWPSASFVTGQPMTSNFTGFQPAFVSVYPMLLTERFRSDPAWVSHMRAVSDSAAAWTDDNSPRWMTVFSAGTTKAEWGGYHADTLSDAPGRVSTFPALLGLAGRPDGRGWREAGAAYHAYRSGARQTFLGGSQILYRRSSTDPAWSPGDGGLPDVAMGGLGIAELLSPGFAQRVLIGPLPLCSSCVADVGRAGGAYGGDGVLDANDFIVFIDAFFAGSRLVADIGSAGGASGGDRSLDNNDFVVFVERFFEGCSGTPP